MTPIKLFNEKYSICQMFLNKYNPNLILKMSLYGLYFYTPILVFKCNWVVIFYIFELIMLRCNKGFLNYIFVQREKWSRQLIDKYYSHLKEFSNSTMFDIQKNAIKKDKLIEHSGYSLKEVREQIEKKISFIANIYVTLSIAIITGLYFGGIRQAMGVTSDFYYIIPSHYKIIMLFLETSFILVLVLIPKFIYTIHIDTLNNFHKIVSVLINEEQIKVLNQIILLNNIDYSPKISL